MKTEKEIKQKLMELKKEKAKLTHSLGARQLNKEIKMLMWVLEVNKK